MPSADPATERLSETGEHAQPAGTSSQSTDAHNLRLTPEPESTVEVRISRRRYVVIEVGYNGFAGHGLQVGGYLTPQLAVEAGGGIGLQGYRIGLRARYHLSQQAVAPFVGTGVSYDFGRLGAQDVDGDSSKKEIVRGLQGVAIQAVAGFNWMSRGGLTLTSSAGWFFVPIDRNNKLDENGEAARAYTQSIYPSTAGSGPVVTVAFGWAF